MTGSIIHRNKSIYMLPVNLQGVCHLRTPDRLMGVFPSCSEETTLPDAFQSVAVADNSIITLRKCRAPTPFTLRFSLKDGRVNSNLLQYCFRDGHKLLNKGPGSVFQWLNHLPTRGTLWSLVKSKHERPCSPYSGRSVLSPPNCGKPLGLQPYTCRSPDGSRCLQNLCGKEDHAEPFTLAVSLGGATTL